MAYNGTTAGSSISNPPIRIAGGVGGPNQQSTGTGGGRSVWLYSSSNGSTELISSTYISDGKLLGFQNGDLLIGVHATGSSIGISMGVIGFVSSIGSTVYSCGVLSTGGQLSSSR